MIIGFAGTPGSGKSYEAVKKILDNLKLGRKVYTNIDGLQDPDKLEHIKDYTGLDDYQVKSNLIYMPDVEMQIFWTKVEEGSLIVIDEVHRLFSNREWASKSNKEFCDWASTHRHYGYDVCLITQDMEKIDKHCRSLIEWTYFYRKVNQFGGLVKKSYMCWAYTGDNTKGKSISPPKRRVYDSRIFACYSSYGNAAVKELGIMKHANILKQPVFYAIPVALACVVYFGFQSYGSGGVLVGQIKADAQAFKDKKNGVAPKPKQEIRDNGKNIADNVVNDRSVVDVSSIKQGESAPTSKGSEGPDKLNQVKVYKVGKRLVYTNNDIVPTGGKYVKLLF